MKDAYKDCKTIEEAFTVFMEQLAQEMGKQYAEFAVAVLKEHAASIGKTIDLLTEEEVKTAMNKALDERKKDATTH